ncbi:MAG: hypothetical protein KUG79_16485, partial [Pseudomonadales bacterium]|nr:hypothetical protein [Pseudomonadales bacterium]
RQLIAALILWWLKLLGDTLALFFSPEKSRTDLTSQRNNQRTLKEPIKNINKNHTLIMFIS